MKLVANSLTMTEALRERDAFAQLPASIPSVSAIDPISLAPGFSRVFGGENAGKQFQRFTRNGQ